MSTGGLDFDRLLSSHEVGSASIARRLRELIRELDPSVVEVVWTAQGIAGFGIGKQKQTEHYAYIAPHRDHVNLGFNHGARLPDPLGLLEGTGKLFRHIKIRDFEEIQRPGLSQLLMEAKKERVRHAKPRRSAE